MKLPLCITAGPRTGRGGILDVPNSNQGHYHVMEDLIYPHLERSGKLCSIFGRYQFMSPCTAIRTAVYYINYLILLQSVFQLLGNFIHKRLYTARIKELTWNLPLLRETTRNCSAVHIVQIVRPMLITSDVTFSITGSFGHTRELYGLKFSANSHSCNEKKEPCKSTVCRGEWRGIRAKITRS